MAKPEGRPSRPIGQFMSQNNTSKMIGFFLANMFPFNFKLPVQVVVDDSAALIAACVSTFTSCISTKNYVQNCFNALCGMKENLPECYIRLDVSHFTKNVVKNSCLKSADERVRRMYRCTIGLIMNCTSPESIAEIIKLVCLIAQSQYIDVGDTKDALVKLKDLIATNLTNDIERENEDEDVEPNDSELKDLDSDNECNLRDQMMKDVSMPWLDDIYNSVSLCDDKGDIDNIYYSDHFFKYLKKILLRLPLWSGVMNKFFNESDPLPPTSAFCESSFNIVKNIIFKTESLPLRIDKFVEGHINSIEGLLKLTLAENKQNKGSEVLSFFLSLYHVIFF